MISPPVVLQECTTRVAPMWHQPQSTRQQCSSTYSVSAPVRLEGSRFLPSLRRGGEGGRAGDCSRGASHNQGLGGGGGACLGNLSLHWSDPVSLQTLCIGAGWLEGLGFGVHVVQLLWEVSLVTSWGHLLGVQRRSRPKVRKGASGRS